MEPYISIYLPPAPPYFREIWDFKSANIVCIQKSINNFDWARSFQNQNCNEQCRIVSETLLNVFRNSIPHKIKKFDYKIPASINKSMVLSLKRRSKLTKKYHMNPTVSNKEVLDIPSQECTSLMNQKTDILLK